MATLIHIYTVSKHLNSDGKVERSCSTFLCLDDKKIGEYTAHAISLNYASDDPRLAGVTIEPLSPPSGTPRYLASRDVEQWEWEGVIGPWQQK